MNSFDSAAATLFPQLRAPSADRRPRASSLGAVPSRDHHEALWRRVPEGLVPRDFQLRLGFLLENVQPGDRVLDVGCGEGDFAVELLRAGAVPTAADVAEEPLRRARARDPQLDLRMLDGEGAWELEDASFDVVWAGEVIQHVADTSSWLSEARRVLRSDGLLLLSAPALGRRELVSSALSRESFARRFEPRGGDLRHYSRATLVDLISDFGFREVAVRAAGGRLGAGRVLLARATRSRF
jgi:2-polyprenyl-3-methyl-5-hydroxy-6-metoxy-1,4-benzoquinol methylase